MAWSIFSFPEIAAFLAMAIGRVGWMFVQQLLRKERYTPAEANGLLMSISGALAFIIPFAWATVLFILAFVPFLQPFLPFYSFSDAS